MALPRPVLNTQVAFDATQAHTFTFTVYGSGAQVTANKLTIRKQTDNSIVYPEWIFYHINTCEFIDGGKMFMTGTAGQQRVDINYVKQYQIPVPSLDEQKKLLDEIHREQALIEPSKEVIRTFNAKIRARIREIWGE